MRYSHVFLTRPSNEARDLAAMLSPLGLEVVIQPAFDFLQLDAAAEQPEVLAHLKDGAGSGWASYRKVRPEHAVLPPLGRQRPGRWRPWE
jgi:hypothetical protein